MSIVNTLHSKNSETFKVLKRELKSHYLRLIEVKGSLDPKSTLKQIKSFKSKSKLQSDLLLVRKDKLYAFGNKSYKAYTASSLENSISSYILSRYKHGLGNLSCRTKDLQMLSNLVIDGSPDFGKSPEKWIRTNPFFDRLRPKPFYDRLLAFNLDQRGMFLKVWQYRAQRNYFHPAVNSGLPLIKKKDPIHEGTFMMHDMFHYIFFDPIITGRETDKERVVYIACRMMSEACTLVLADMIAVAHSGIESLGYDIAKRKIYPLFKSLKLNPYDIETIRKVLYANCAYVMFGDFSVYKKLGASIRPLNMYTGKYENFFSGDFTWNEGNIKRVLQEMQSTPGLAKYFAGLDKEYKKFNTKSLTKKISNRDGSLSFNKLFEVFWDQLISLILYENASNKLAYAQKAYLKYISGQMYVVYKYENLPEAKILIKEYGRTIDRLKNSKNQKVTCKTGVRFVRKINKFIEFLEKNGYITRIESKIYKLHVPHFPAEYINYDQDNFEALEKVSKRILGKYFARESFSYKSMEPHLREYYFKIVGGNYA